jgi:methionyl aminopeptidase
MIFVKSPEEIKIMEEGGRLLARIAKNLAKMAKAGIATKEIDRAAEALILKSGGEFSFKGHEGFPSATCLSVNEEIVHTVPSDRILKEGDILTIDIGMIYKGYHSDMAVTIPIGEVSPEALRIIRVTKKALKRGIKKAKIGNTFGDIGNSIQRYVESQGFSVVKDLCGHGIGKELQEDPQILNYGKRHSGEKIKEGMVFCLEPIISAGSGKMKRGPDGFSYITADGSLSAHFEHMMAAGKEGGKVLTPLN